MSMGILLKQVRDHLRESMSLAAGQCDIRPEGMPPASAGDFFVAVDDLQVESDARAHLRETYHIEVSIWRRAGAYPDDRQGDIALAEDPYVSGLMTLDRLERSVIRHLHGNYSGVTVPANEAAEAGSDEGGDVFQLALYYCGRGRTELLNTHASRGGAPDWIGRRLRFAGMDRVQATDIIH